MGQDHRSNQRVLKSSKVCMYCISGGNFIILVMENSYLEPLGRINGSPVRPQHVWIS